MNDKIRFSVRDVIKTGWHNVKGAKWSILAPQIVILLFYIAIGVIFGLLGAVTGILHKPNMPTNTGALAGGLILFEFIMIFLISPLIAGAQMVALKKLRGEPVSTRTGFQYWHKWFSLGLTVLFFTIGSVIINQISALLVRVFVGIPMLSALTGLIFGVLALEFAVFFMFNILFVADKNKGPWNALVHSAQMVSPHWFRVTVLAIYMGVTFIIAVLPLILGFVYFSGWLMILPIAISVLLIIWLIPYWYLLFATIYHRLAGKNKEINHAHVEN